MPATIPDNYQTKYHNRWGTLLQQEASRLQAYATVEQGLKGEIVFFDQYGLIDFEEKTTRMSKTNLDEAPTLRRAMRPRQFTKAIGFDEFDANKLGDLDLPIQKTQEGLRNAAARLMDKVMISSFLGTNYAGQEGLDPKEISQIIPANYVETGTATASNLTIAKLRATLQKFHESEAWNDDAKSRGDQLVMVVTSSQIMSLLRTTEATSIDFNNVKALVNGEIDTFMGFKFIRTQALPLDGNIRTNLAWVKSRAQFGIWESYKCKLSVRDDMDETLQIRAKFSCGATRLEESAFAKILCDETK